MSCSRVFSFRFSVFSVWSRPHPVVSNCLLKSENRKLKTKSAFTLIEVVVAIFILAILASMLYGIVGGSLKATAALVDQQSVHEEMRGFIDLGRRTLRTMPPEASIDSSPREDEGKYFPAITLRDIQVPYDWSIGHGYVKSVQVSTRPQLGGLSQIGILLPKQTDDQGNEIDTPFDDRWLTLMNNVRDVSWRYYDGRAQSWSDEWHDPNVRPSLIEMNIQPAFPTNIIRTVFYVPPSVRPENFNARATPPPTLP